jgi:hypothetical protein
VARFSGLSYSRKPCTEKTLEPKKDRFREVTIGKEAFSIESATKRISFFKNRLSESVDISSESYSRKIEIKISLIGGVYDYVTVSCTL